MQVVVLPEDPVVLFVEAHRVGDGVGVALLGREHRVEVVDHAEAVAPELQRVPHPPEAPLTRVERVLPPVHRAGIAVRHDHLRDGRAVEHRPHAVGVVVLHGVENEALVRVERHAERPARPADVVAVDDEARALRLHDLQRFEVGAHRPDVGGQVRPRVGGHGDDAEVDDLEHLARALVEERDHTFDRLGVAVVGVLVPQVRDAPGDPTPGLVLGTERARGPGVDLHEVEVLDAPAAQRGLPVRVLLHADDGHHRLAEEQRGAHVGVHRPREDRALGDGHHDLDGLEPARRHEERLDRAATGAPAWWASTTSFAGSWKRTCTKAASASKRGSARITSTARLTSSVVRASSGCARASVIQPPAAVCWRMYSAVPAMKPSTLLAFPVTKSLKYSGM